MAKPLILIIFAINGILFGLSPSLDVEDHAYLI
jgi:hypothetical protein